MNEAHNFYRSRLRGAEAQLYDEIVSAQEQQAASVSAGRGITLKNALSVYGKVRNDHPEMIQLENDIKLSSSLFSSQVLLHYGLNLRQRTELIGRMQETAHQILASIDRSLMSESEVVRALHDYLAVHVKYNLPALEQDRITFQDTNAHGALLYGTAVCHGYAQAMKYLCDQAGIECLVVIGKSNLPQTKQQMDHAWNIVKANGYYQHVDVTWDSNLTRDPENPCMDYFMLNDENILMDHVFEMSQVPKCPEEPCNYYHANQLEVTGLKDIDRIVRDAAFMESHTIGFKVKNWGLKPQEIEERTTAAIMNEFESNSGEYSYEYIVNEDQNTYWFYVHDAS